MEVHAIQHILDVSVQQDLIKRKRDGNELSMEEIQFFTKSVCDSNNNSIQESQIGYIFIRINLKVIKFKIKRFIFKSYVNGNLLSWNEFRRSISINQINDGS